MRPALMMVLLAGGCVPKPEVQAVSYPSALPEQQVRLLPQKSTDSDVDPSQASWWQQISPPEREVFVGASPEAAIWVDKTYRVEPGGTRVAFLHWEFPAPKAPSYLSERTVEEIDCDLGRSRVLESYVYSQRLAGGQLLHSDVRPVEWTYVQPGSTIDGVARLVCPAKASATPRKHRAPVHKTQPGEEAAPLSSDYL